MIITCPRCGRILPAAETNVTKDLAVCGGCSNAFRLSEILHSHPTSPVDLSAPPGGAWFRESADGFEAGATTRSALAFFIVPFTLVWSGGAMGGLYGTQIATGQFSVVMSIFGLPFLAGSILLWSVALMAAAGKCRITVKGDDATMFTGVGPLGFRRRFRWSDVQTVTETPAEGRRSGGLYLEARSRLSFASQVNQERRYFLLRALRSRVRPEPAPAQPPYRG